MFYFNSRLFLPKKIRKEEVFISSVDLCLFRQVSGVHTDTPKTWPLGEKQSPMKKQTSVHLSLPKHVYFYIWISLYMWQCVAISCRYMYIRI